MSFIPCSSIGGRYQYTRELLALEAVPTFPLVKGVAVSGALPVARWDHYLQSHPDRDFAEFLRRGIRHGFKIGFNRSSQLRSPKRNYESSVGNPGHAQRYISEEVAARRLRQVPHDSLAHWSPIGLVPKDHQPGKFRLIIDLSSPCGASVNDGISSQLTSLTYPKVDDAVSLVRSAGRGALMAKLDLKAAYRRVPVHPDDQALLAVKWGGSLYLDTALPFGLCSAPKLFTAMADGLSWAMMCEGVSHFIHYIDDFFFCPPMTPDHCKNSLQVAVHLCEGLGFSVAPEKVVGPTTTLIFLGIELDSVKMEMRLPRGKLERLQISLGRWLDKDSATKRQLQSIIGQLSDAAIVVRPGRTFLRSLIRTSTIPKKQDHKIRLNMECKADLHWWNTFISGWNGTALFPGRPLSDVVTADASGSWGCGALLEDGTLWFQFQWPPSWSEVNIATKELFPLVMAAALWGTRWRGGRILFRSDNQAVVAALASYSARDPPLVHLLRCLFFFEAYFEFEHVVEHVPGSDNGAADALSRNKVTSFLSLLPQANPSPSPTPQPLVELLSDKSLVWTSPRWRQLLEATLRVVSRQGQ